MDWILWRSHLFKSGNWSRTLRLACDAKVSVFLLMEMGSIFPFFSILSCSYSCFVWAGIHSNSTMTRKMDPCLKGVYHSTRWFLCLKDIVNEFMLFIAVYNWKSSYIGLLTWPLTCLPYVAGYVSLLTMSRWYCNIFPSHVM